MAPRILSQEVMRGLYVLRVDDEKVRYFEAIWSIPEKVTYNAYLLVGNDEAVLFDGWKSTYADDLVETIKKIVDLRDVKHIIVHHAEPDHSGSLPRVLEANGFRAEVVTYSMGKSIIEAFYNMSPKFRIVRDCDELVLAGERIKIIQTPWLHWPETMMSYLSDRRILVSCDAFGGYSVPRSVFDDDDTVREYLPSVRKYVATVIGSYRQHIVRNIEKIQKIGLSIDVIAPAHGIIWRNRPQLILDYYRALAEGCTEDNKILLISGSMYGLMEAAARTTIKEVERLGGRVVFYRFNDFEQPQFSDILGDAIDSKAIILATPTYEAGVYPPLDQLVDLISRKIPPKPVLVIVSYGWASVAAKKISEKLESSGFKLIEVIEFHGSAGEKNIQKIREGVKKLIECS